MNREDKAIASEALLEYAKELEALGFTDTEIGSA